MIYLDTSVVVSVCCIDANSSKASALLRSTKDTLLITTLGELEAINAIELRVLRREMSPSDAVIALGNLEADLGAGIYQLLPVPEPAFARAGMMSRQFTRRIGVRSADLLHVAAALELDAARLFSFDLRQREAAKAAGLKMNPLP